jgi:outer membrane murein-binding lipoprotein Lpp
MARLAFVATVVAVVVALYTLTSASPVEHEKGDSLSQVKSLGEEIRRLSVKVGELEKQVSALRAAPEHTPLFVRASEQVLLPGGIELPTAMQPQPVHDSVPWSYDTCKYVFLGYVALES